jgi:hypothetical protein
MTKHIMLDTETWGTAPGCDLRSIGACLFDPVTGRVAGFDDPLIDIGAQFTFHVACNNPLIGTYSRDHLTQAQLDEIGGVYRKYNLTRDPQTVKWWNDQSDEAKASFANPVDLAAALESFRDWLEPIQYGANAEGEDIRLWSHGPSFDPPILAAAYAACGLSVPWHYRAPRDTRTALELAGMDPHKGLEPFNTGTHHNALDDAICQARAVCEAYRRLCRSAAWWNAKDRLEKPRYYPFTETDCPNHVSSNRTCANCGINISELEP